MRISELGRKHHDYSRWTAEIAAEQREAAHAGRSYCVSQCAVMNCTTGTPE